jgi:hypothetical protein
VFYFKIDSVYVILAYFLACIRIRRELGVLLVVVDLAVVRYLLELLQRYRFVVGIRSVLQYVLRF